MISIIDSQLFAASGVGKGVPLQQVLMQAAEDWDRKCPGPDGETGNH